MVRRSITNTSAEGGYGIPKALGLWPSETKSPDKRAEGASPLVIFY